MSLLGVIGVWTLSVACAFALLAKVVFSSKIPALYERKLLAAKAEKKMGETKTENSPPRFRTGTQLQAGDLYN
jgi:hypothetical protein